MSLCPLCHFDNRAGVLFCEDCGEDLYDSLMEVLPTKKLREMRRNGSMVVLAGHDTRPLVAPMVLQIRNVSEPLPIDRVGRLVMGRTGEDGEQPDIDLTPYDAELWGVSRQHAVLEAGHEIPVLFDLGSFNGTYLNGQKLLPEQAYPLSSGDEIRLGRLVMQVFYK